MTLCILATEVTRRGALLVREGHPELVTHLVDSLGNSLVWPRVTGLRVLCAACLRVMRANVLVLTTYHYNYATRHLGLRAWLALLTCLLISSSTQLGNRYRSLRRRVVKTRCGQ